MARVTTISPYMGILAIIYIFTSFDCAEAFIGYDCSVTNTKKITLPLLDTDYGNFNVYRMKTFTEEIALLQLENFDNIQIDQCKIEVRTVIQCEKFPNTSVVNTFIEPISREDCRHALTTRSITWRGFQFVDLEFNKIITRKFSINGACSGNYYEDPYGTWNNVVVRGSVNLFLNSEKATVKIELDKVILPSGDKCKFSKGDCVDDDGVFNFWDPVPKDNCSNSFTQLYKGTATKLVYNEETVYTMNVKNTSFSFIVRGNESSCGITLLKTESFKHFIVDSDNLPHLTINRIVGQHSNTDNVNIFRIFNSKFVYIEEYIRSQVKSLYVDVMKRSSNLRKEKLQHALAFALTQPDEFAFQLMDGPGYMAKIVGKEVHIWQCVPVEVKYAVTDKCYNRLPIQNVEDKLFLMPRTHVITDQATEIPCNTPLRAHYKIKGKWYTLTPQPVEVPKDLRQGELYYQGFTDSDAMRDHIMAPLEQTGMAPTTSNSIQGPIPVKNALTIYVDSLVYQVLPEIWTTTCDIFFWVGE